jgi:WD40 repeat protein
VETLEGHTQGITCCKTRGDYIISGSSDKTLRIWELQKNTTLNSSIGTAGPGYLNTRTLHGHQSGIKTLDLDDRLLFSVSNDQQMKIWHLESGNCLYSFTTSMNGISCMLHDPNRHLAVFGTLDGHLNLWRLVKRPHIEPISIERDAEVTQQYNLQVYHSLYNWANNPSGIFESKQVFRLHSRWVLDCKVDDWRLISVGSDGVLNIYNYHTDSNLYALKSDTGKAFTSVQYEDRCIIAGCVDGNLYYWSYE